MIFLLAYSATAFSFITCHATRSNPIGRRGLVRPKKINDFRSTLTGIHRRGRKPKNDREMMEAMLWILRTGAPWRDLPMSFPPWQSVYARFRKWREIGLWSHLLGYFREELADEEYLMIDSSGVRVHQDASRVKEANFQQAMGRSKGGLSTKIHMACDALGYPLGFILTGAERHDCTQARALIERFVQAEQKCLMDAGYDSDDIRSCVMQQGATAVIAYRKNRVKVPEFDKDIYKERHKVENLFQKIKRYRHVAMRFEKLQTTFAAMVAIASILVWIKF